ncbi:MAG: hypothetical protein Q4D58_08930 [Synergistaceae bacterium]|nr:hypothetical protein [Synergistaceae bacterium]
MDKELGEEECLKEYNEVVGPCEGFVSGILEGRDKKMKTEYTPGPWVVHIVEGKSKNCSPSVEITRLLENGRVRDLIAKMYGFGLPEGKANASLIAAAPEMADVLIKHCAECEREVCSYCSVGRVLHKAGVSLPKRWNELEVDDDAGV